jgi:hypothetical protein
MAYSTKGKMHYVLKGIESQTLQHLQPVRVDTEVGIAIKQKAYVATEGIAALSTIAKKEGFVILVKGVTQVPVGEIATPAKGDLVYITAENKLTKTVGSNFAFGKIVELAGERGTPTGFLRIDLDQKV